MKTFLQYAALVGLSILGILGILRLGRGLQAPPSVGGRWALEWSMPPGGVQACSLLPPADGSPELLISQSGPQLRLALNDAGGTVFSGVLQGLRIHALSTPGRDWWLEASVDRGAEPDQLSATLTSNGCAGVIQFTGLRLPHRTSLTGEH